MGKIKRRKGKKSWKKEYRVVKEMKTKNNRERRRKKGNKSVA